MPLPISPVASVTINLPGVGSTTSGFNMALIVGPSTIISTGTRVVVYSSLDEMTTAGFATNAAEYLAAVKYFAANGSPSKVAVGVKGSSETWLEAVTACRLANTDWYACYCTGAADADHTAIAAYIEAASPKSVYAVNTSAAGVKNNTTGNVLELLNAAGYNRTLLQFSTVAHAVMSILGYAMSHTNNDASSNYTLKFKPMPGVTAENLTTAELANIENKYGNAYIQRGSNTGFENGTMVSGKFFDEIIGLDKLANDIQINIANYLYQEDSVPQTTDGVKALCTVTAAACQRAVIRGFLAPGIWSNGTVLELKNGDYLDKGYLVLSLPIDDQSDADRQARICPPIYANVKESGSIHSTSIVINVNR